MDDHLRCLSSLGSWRNACKLLRSESGTDGLSISAQARVGKPPVAPAARMDKPPVAPAARVSHPWHPPKAQCRDRNTDRHFSVLSFFFRLCRIRDYLDDNLPDVRLSPLGGADDVLGQNDLGSIRASDVGDG